MDESDNRDQHEEEVKIEIIKENIYDETPEPLQKRKHTNRQSTMVPQLHPPKRKSAFVEDPNLPPVTMQRITLYDGMQMPYVIRELPPCEIFELPTRPNKIFSHEFLKKVFGGSPISNGCYKIAARNRERRLFPELDIYRVLKAENEPLLPRQPGQHGARISCIFSEGEIEGNFPLFISDSGAGAGYRYYGTYREPRASNILGRSEMCCVPNHVKLFWARLLGTRNGNGKSRNALDTLMLSWPRVSVGWLDEDTGEIIEFDAAREPELGSPITRAITEDEAAGITEEEVLDALNRADYDLNASVALFYEYLQCVGYDAKFYEKLVVEYRKFQRQRRS